MNKMELSDSRRKSRLRERVPWGIAMIDNAEAGNSSRSATIHELFKGSQSSIRKIMYTVRFVRSYCSVSAKLENYHSSFFVTLIYAFSPGSLKPVSRIPAGALDYRQGGFNLP